MIKKAIGIVVVLAAGYVAASWWTGQVAHRSVDAAVAEAEKMYGGVFKIVDRKSSNGIFRSIEDITIEVSAPIPAGQTVATDGVRLQPVQLNANEDPAQDDETVDADAAAVPPFKFQFTIHNDIRHGPVPGLALGLARIETSLVFDEFVQRMLKGLLDTDKPFRVLTTLGFTGGGRVQALSPAMKIALPMNTGTIEWRGMDIGVDFTRGMRELTIDGGMPGFAMITSEGPGFNFEQLTVTGKLRKHLENLYVGNEEVRIKSVAYKLPGDASDPTAQPTEAQISDILYGFVITDQADKVNVSIRLGAGEYRGAPTALDNIRFNFSINGLHAETASQIYKQFETFGMQADDSQAALDTLADVSQMFVKLLEHSPELVLDDIGFSTDEGELKITGRAAFAGVDAQDPSQLAAQLGQKLAATVEIDLAQPVLDKLTGTPDSVEQMIAQLEQEGYVSRRNKQVGVKLVYADGAITANDKPLDPSAFGGLFGGQSGEEEMVLEMEEDAR